MMTDIEVEARAYVEAYSHQYASGTPGAFEYLVGMLKVIDELRKAQPQHLADFLPTGEPNG